MRFLQSFTQPVDRRWHGKQRYGPLLMLPIALLVSLIWIFFIAAMIYSRIFYDEHPWSYYNQRGHWNDPRPPIDWDSASYNVWVSSTSDHLHRLIANPTDIEYISRKFMTLMVRQ